MSVYMSGYMFMSGSMVRLSDAVRCGPLQHRYIFIQISICERLVLTIFASLALRVKVMAWLVCRLGSFRGVHEPKRLL